MRKKKRPYVIYRSYRTLITRRIVSLCCAVHGRLSRKISARIEKPSRDYMYAYNFAIKVRVSSEKGNKNGRKKEREKKIRIGEADAISFDKRIGVFSFLFVNAYYLLFFSTVSLSLSLSARRRLNAIIIVPQ